MKEVTILGQTKELGKHDWPLAKLSDRYEGLAYKEYKENPIDRSRPVQASAVDHIKVMCFDKERKEDVDVKIPLSETNVDKLKKLEFGNPIDFGDCIVGHYVNGFNQVSVTIKANELIILGNVPKQPNK